MAKYQVKDYETIVMDGSNIGNLCVIIREIDGITGEQYGKSTYRSLDSDHPTMIVVTTRTNHIMYERIKDDISKLYPGLCVFNPQM